MSASLIHLLASANLATASSATPPSELPPGSPRAAKTGASPNTTLVAALLALLGAIATPTPLDAQQPNFIVILSDDLGYNDLGCFGSAQIKTPNIDRMANEGIRFTSFYAQAVCGPSRAALLTGCYPIRVAEPGNRKNQHTILHPNEVTLAEILQQNGYATACIGKWHLGQKQGNRWNPATMPNAQGFDHFFGTPLYNGFTVRVADTKFRSQLLRNQTVLRDSIENWDTITADYTREAVSFIQTNQAKPFFLYLAHNMPHIPLGAGDRFKGRSAYGPYGDAVEEIDWSTGQILDIIRNLGLADNTLVVFTSDNGPWIETTRGNQPRAKPFIPRNHSGTADPLRGYKMLTWEGGLRVPCVMWWPNRIPAGHSCNEVAATIDLLPTFTKLIGAKTPLNRPIDGRDISSLLFNHPNATSPHDQTGFFFYRYTALEAVRSGPWKLVLPRPEHPAWTGWSGRFHGSGVDTLSLFNLDQDIAEQYNVAKDYPEVTARLMDLISKARADLGDYDRIGAGARFFDDGPKRPDLWKPRSNNSVPPQEKPVPYDNPKPAGNLRFDFQSGQLDGWRIVQGSFGQP